MNKIICHDCNSPNVHFDEKTEEGRWYSCNRCNGQFCVHKETEIDRRRKAAMIRRQAFINNCTCENCAEKFDCEFSFDLYNANGDCMKEK